MANLCVHKREEHITDLCQVFEKCQVYCICLNPDICKFMVRQRKILGHIVLKNGISTDEKMIAIIVDFPIPINAKGVQISMGHCGYHRRFIYMYAKIVKPLYALLFVFEWTDSCEVSFEKLKKALMYAPILRAPNWYEIFHVHIDASAFVISYILAQLGEKNIDF